MPNRSRVCCRGRYIRSPPAVSVPLWDPRSPAGDEGGEVAGLEVVSETHLPEDGLCERLDLGERCLGGGDHGAEAWLCVEVPDDVADLEDPLGKVPVLLQKLLDFLEGEL